MAEDHLSARKSPWLNEEERARERETKREAILSTAVSFFNTKGFHATSLDDVAVALRVTKPTIYHYFSSKDEILYECVRKGLETVQKAAGAAERRGGSGLDRLKAIIRDYAIIATRDFGACVTRTADHELSDASRAKFRSLKREIDQTIRRVIQDGIDDGSIAPGDVRMIAFTMSGALNWISRWYREDGDLSPEEMADLCVETLVRGLAPRDGAGR